MILALAAIIYISFLCWSWGSAIIRLLQRISGGLPPSYHFSIVCITGLAAITVTGSLLSLFIPLGGWQVQLIFLLPAVLFWLKNPSDKLKTISSIVSGYHISVFVLLAATILMVLVMHSWKIVHPDTLGYHAQTIRWIEDYKAVPGLVHLQSRLGYQGSWFVSGAIFSFRFMGTEAVTFINIAVACWFLLFVTSKINRHLFKDANKAYAIPWLGLLVFSVWSYTQLRLFTTSASPDFIAAIMVWLVLYLFFKKENREGAGWHLVIMLSLFAITLKLSSAPLLIITFVAIMQLVKLKSLKQVFAAFIFFLLIVSPFITRNIITTGYVIFPSTTPDIVHVDWKYDAESTLLEKKYISAYARMPVDFSEEEIYEVLDMSATEWMPRWWGNRSAADKTILILLLVSFMIAILKLRKIRSYGSLFTTGILTLLAGIVFWYLQAPDPRFGFGFIMPFIGISASLLLSHSNKILNGQKFMLSLVIAASLVIASYTGYRFVYFFSPKQLLTPAGIENAGYSSFDCEGINFIIPDDDKDCGSLPVPCVSDSCKNFMPRGEKITDGFRSRH